MNRYFSFDGENFKTHETAEEARQKALDALEAATDGDFNEPDRICWGVMRERVTEHDRRTLAEVEAAGDEFAATMRRNGWDYTATYRLEAMIDPRLLANQTIRQEAERLARELHPHIFTENASPTWLESLVEAFARLLSAPSRPETRDYLWRTGLERALSKMVFAGADDVDGLKWQMVLYWLRLRNDPPELAARWLEVHGG